MQKCRILNFSATNEIPHANIHIGAVLYCLNPLSFSMSFPFRSFVHAVLPKAPETDKLKARSDPRGETIMNVACILAGGSGARMPDTRVPKQYRLLGGIPVLVWSMLSFDKCERINLLCVVAAQRYHDLIVRWAGEYEIHTPVCLALPGKERFDSAYSALCAVEHACHRGDIILFHDAARPLIGARIISNNIRLAKDYDGVYTAVLSQDSAFLSEDGRTLSSLLPRADLWQGQTPQSFRFEIIKRAHENYRAMENPPHVTDDCSLVHLMGGSIAICRGDKRNLKITTEEDFLLLQEIVSREKQDAEASGTIQKV